MGKVVSIIGCLVLLASLTGCGGVSTSNNNELSNSDRVIKWFDGLHGDQFVVDGIREYNLDEFPGVTFRWLSDHLYAVTDEETVPLDEIIESGELVLLDDTIQIKKE